MNRRSFLAGLLGSTAAVALPLPADFMGGVHSLGGDLRFHVVGQWVREVNGRQSA